jgi:hypothetical protein
MWNIEVVPYVFCIFNHTQNCYSILVFQIPFSNIMSAQQNVWWASNTYCWAAILFTWAWNNIPKENLQYILHAQQHSSAGRAIIWWNIFTCDVNSYLFVSHDSIYQIRFWHARITWIAYLTWLLWDIEITLYIFFYLCPMLSLRDGRVHQKFVIDYSITITCNHVDYDYM